MVVLTIQFKQKVVSLAEAKSVNEAMVSMIDKQPGFVSKMRLGNNDTGEFAGAYQFETKEKAEAYIQSNAIAFLKNLLTLDGELIYEIYGLYREQVLTSIK
ncbi:YdhR family protein [Chloroflexota bacterium]